MLKRLELLKGLERLERVKVVGGVRKVKVVVTDYRNRYGIPVVIAVNSQGLVLEVKKQTRRVAIGCYNLTFLD